MDMSLPQPSQSFTWTQEPWGPSLRCRPLLAVAPHLFTTRALDVSRDPGDPALAAVAASLSLTAAHIIQVHQVHGAGVLVVQNGVPASPGTPIEADAMVSEDPSRAIGVRVADCAPILLADRTTGRVAAVHAGWRGTVARVVAAAVDATKAMGTRPDDLVVAIGPSIGPCCYEVGPEVREAFLAAGHAEADVSRWCVAGRGDRWQLDVPAANRDQLVALGVPAAQIHVSGLCTACHPDVFHSYRRNRSAGRMLGLVRTRS